MSALVLEISKDFTFDAAHHFTHKDAGHPFSRVHGHSFAGTVTLSGARATDSGMVRDFWEIDAELANIRDQLDHRLLNEIAGLETPTLERLCLWAAGELKPQLPGLARDAVARPSLNERCELVLTRG